MKRKVFYSFHYKPDCWRIAQVRNMGVVEGNHTVTDHQWEEVINKGNKEIQNWIDDNLFGRSCLIVLIGKDTAGRKWVEYEIKKAWNDGKGVLGVYIHNLKNSAGEQTDKGENPFDNFKVGQKKLSDIMKVYNPPYSTSTYVYDHIKENIDKWVEDAIAIRNKY